MTHRGTFSHGLMKQKDIWSDALWPDQLRLHHAALWKIMISILLRLPNFFKY